MTKVVHKAFAASQAADVRAEMKTFVNNNSVGTACKFSMSDMIEKDARGVVFYLSGDVRSKVEPQYNGHYETQDFSTDTNYDTMYQQVATWMSENLTDQQFFLASIDFTNARKHDATMTVWYPKL